MTATRIRISTHPWTLAQEEELRRLARSNMSVTDIAARLARTPEQVFERAHELGLTLKRARRAPENGGIGDREWGIGNKNEHDSLSPLPVPHSLFPTPYSPLPIPHSLLPL